MKTRSALVSVRPTSSRFSSMAWRPISGRAPAPRPRVSFFPIWILTSDFEASSRSEEHTSELQSPVHLVCRLLLEKKNTRTFSAAHRPAPPLCRRRPVSRDDLNAAAGSRHRQHDGEPHATQHYCGPPVAPASLSTV